MTDRIEELAKMAYEAGHHPTSADFADIGPAAKENLRIIARTLYAAIMTEARGVAEAEKLTGRPLPQLSSQEIALVMGAVEATKKSIATALHARAKEMSDA